MNSALRINGAKSSQFEVRSSQLIASFQFSVFSRRHFEDSDRFGPIEGAENMQNPGGKLQISRGGWGQKYRNAGGTEGMESNMASRTTSEPSSRRPGSQFGLCGRGRKLPAKALEGFRDIFQYVNGRSRSSLC
jgi:hypothetical protein